MAIFRKATRIWKLKKIHPKPSVFTMLHFLDEDERTVFSFFKSLCNQMMMHGGMCLDNVTDDFNFHKCGLIGLSSMKDSFFFFFQHLQGPWLHYVNVQNILEKGTHPVLWTYAVHPDTKLT